MKRTLGIGIGRMTKRKPRVPGVKFARRKSRARKKRMGIWYIVFPNGSRISTGERMPSQAEDAALLQLRLGAHFYQPPPNHHIIQEELHYHDTTHDHQR